MIPTVIQQFSFRHFLERVRLVLYKIAIPFNHDYIRKIKEAVYSSVPQMNKRQI
jgi:hypothetical protein